MKMCLSLTFLLLTILFTAGAAPAKTFYLKDGATIQYKRVWTQGGRIFVLINRDTLVDFSPEEVDQRRTLKAAGLKKFPRLTAKKKKPARVAPPPETGAVGDTEKPLSFSDTLPAPAPEPQRNN